MYHFSADDFRFVIMEDFSSSIYNSLKHYGRGIAGGLLFSLPMLYTMEMWWTGFIAGPLELIIYLCVGIFLLMMYNHYVGLSHDHTWKEGLVESMQEMGLGLVLTIFILWITNRIGHSMSLDEVLGKTIVESVTVAIGISVGKTQLGGNADQEVEDTKEEIEREPHLLRSVNIALCGSVLVASNVAPTDEIVSIALESPAWKLFMVSLVSIGIGGAILYYINFKGAKQWVVEPDTPWGVVSGVFIMYAVALISSAFMLWFFGRFEGLAFPAIVAETVVLGFPAALGASAGRLLIES